MARSGANATDATRFISLSAVDTYTACVWTSAHVALIFGVFKCRSLADILFGLSATDAQLELHAKHYEKLKRKSLYWIAFLCGLVALHGWAMYTLLTDGGIFDINAFIADVLAQLCTYTLDLQFLYLTMVLCKRFRLENKILVHITRPWKTFR